MRYYSNQNVFDAGLDRIRYIYDEFPLVICNFSGGKDSTVCLHLCLQVAREKNRLPLKVLFIDQEAEYQNAIDYIREVMNHPDVEPLWIQAPFKIFNATANKNHWLEAWEEGAEWIRPKEDIAIKENTFGTERFTELFSAISNTMFPNTKTAKISGVRTEESPARFLGLTGQKTYKWITFGRKERSKWESYTFHPLYDWSYTDIWKSIHDNKWSYCKIYDYMYQRGVPIQRMRVSNLHHETAVKSLFNVREVEPDNWNKVCKRLEGINTVLQMGEKQYFNTTLPYMFKDWKEYSYYLVDNLIEEKYREHFTKKFKAMEKMYLEIAEVAGLYQTFVQSIIVNDIFFTKLGNWQTTADIMAFIIYKRDGEVSRKGYNKFVKYYQEHYENHSETSK